MAKTKILIVEDEVIIAEDLQRTLKSMGYAVPAIATSGIQAIKAAEKHNPDLILMDIVLKGDMKGTEAAKEIHTRFNIPVIFVTAYADNKTLEQAKIAEPYGYLVKPIDEKELKSAVEIALYKSGMETKLRESEEFNFALFQHSPVETIVVDSEGKVVKFNLAKRKSGDGLPDIGDVMYKDYAKEYEIDMHAELMKCIKSGKTKTFPELKYRDKYLCVGIASFPQGAIITSQDITECRRMENKLQETNKFLHNILSSSSSVSIISTDLEQNILYWNTGAENIFGYKAEEMVNRRKIDILYYDEDTKKRVKESRVFIRKNKKGINYDTKEKTKDGRMVWINMTLTPRFDEKGRVIGILGVGQDITERRKAEEALRESEEKYRLLVENANDIIFMVDKNNKVLSVNRAAADIFRKKPEEIVNKSIFGLFPQEIAKSYSKNIKKVIKTGKTYSSETKLIAGKKEMAISARLNPVKDDTGRITAVMGISRDITERKKAEKVLEESEEHFRIFASYQEAISELRGFYMADTPFEQMIQKTLDLIIEKFGYYMTWYAELIEEEKVILPKLRAGKYEKYLDGLQLEYESDKKDAKCAMSLAILTKKPFGYADLEHDKDFEKWRAFALQYGYRSNQAIPLIIDGKCKGAFLVYSTRPFAFNEKSVEYLKGIVDELTTIVENITERRKAEEQIKKSLQEKELLLREIQHRVKNNLQVIVSLLSIQSEKVSDPKTLDMFKETTNRITTMALIHAQLYKSGDISNVNVKKFTKELAQTLVGQYSSGKTRLSYSVDVDDLWFPIDISTPCGLILNELITNSLKYAFAGRETGKIKVSVTGLKENEIIMTVSDDGIGMPEGFDISESKGMGYLLVKSMSENQLRGNLEVNSSKKGTTVTVKFKK